MTTPSEKKRYTNMLVEKLTAIADLQLEAKSILESAKGAGLNPKEVSKGAKELMMDASKLADKIEAERQYDLFRSEVGILARKGITEAV